MSSQRVKLTKTFIDQLELMPAIYRDSDLIGFAIRVNNTYKTYIVEKKVLGRTVRSTIGLHGNLTLAQARHIARDKLALMAQGINPNEVKRKIIAEEKLKLDLLKIKPTLKQAFEHYLLYKTLKPRTIKDYTMVVDNYLKDWNDITLDKISRSMIQAKHSELSQRSLAQANMAMRVFRAIYNYSVEHYRDENDQSILDQDNPINTLNAKKAWNKIRSRKTYIHQDQLPEWIKAVFEYKDRGQQLETNRDFLLTLVLTGFRREECESLTWSSIDLKYGRITLIDAKYREPYTLPMGDFLFTLMTKRYDQATNEWVFPSAKSTSGHIVNISKVRQKINKSCGIEFSFHDLRRTFGAIAENLGYDQYTIDRLLNHINDDRDRTRDFVQVSDRKLREAMNTIEDIILGDYKKS
ncbi:integrase [Acinetobacter sp. ACNIH2]|uniref:site-specific integrase n=1 Tax=Acinetobacter sp. ACNIH2 TaxID=1758189 RepID=UPI000CDC955D|nr:site-specific integrase [Acinetobacter sp. ACNIH2]AUX84654.1 integrase [Acinetobacter sp. ACNIH2]